MDYIKLLSLATVLPFIVRQHVCSQWEDFSSHYIFYLQVCMDENLNNEMQTTMKL